MAIKPLVNYIKDELKKGKSKENIRIELMNGGWQLESVSEAFYEVDKAEVPEKVPTQENVVMGKENDPQNNKADQKISTTEENKKIGEPESNDGKPTTPNNSSKVSETKPLQEKKDNLKPLKNPFPRMGLTFGEAWDIYKRRFWTLTSIMLLTTIISATFSVFMSSVMIRNIGDILNERDYFGAVIFFVVYFLVPFLALIGETWGLASLLFAITHHNERAGAVKSLGKGWGKIISFWWLAILGFFIVFGGALFFVIPAIILPISFSMAGFILMSEKISGFDALVKSREYVKNYWWNILFRFLIIAIIYLFLTIIIGALFAIMWELIKDVSLYGIPLTSSIAIQLGTYLYALFAVPFLLAYSYSVYDGLRAMKSGFTYESTLFKKVPYGFLGIIGLIVFILSTLFLLYTYVIKEEVPMLNLITEQTKYLIGIVKEGIQSYYY